MIRISIYLVGFSLISTPYLAHAGAGDFEKPPMVAVGNAWEIKRIAKSDGNKTNTYTYTVTDVTPERILLNRKESGADGEMEVVFSAEMNFISDGSGYKTEPVERLFKFPMILGESRDVRYVRSSGNQIVESAGSCTNSEIEMVTTAAGKFEAMRVECKLNERSRVSSYSAYTKFKLWYSPMVKFAVKREFETRSNTGYWDQISQELVGYK